MKESIISHRILISGGGTGGHVFSAIAIAEEFKYYFPTTKFLFIGAKNKLEIKKVPESGFDIKSIWISGIDRKNIINNLLFPMKLFISLFQCYKIIKKFNPTLAIGTGGFVSGPSLYVANLLKIPIFLQEQNSYPGITNKFLSKKAKKIFVAYEAMDKFFPKEKIYYSGNPIRRSFLNKLVDNKYAKKKLNLNLNKTCILSIGGSLGSETINNFWKKNIKNIPLDKIDLIWQTGSLNFKKYQKLNFNKSIKIIEFIDNISLAYSAADIIISRAGAITISELSIIGKPSILIPFPLATDNHQNINTNYLIKKNAIIKILDHDVNDKLLNQILKLIKNINKQKKISKNLKKLAKINANKEIVNKIIESLIK